MVKRSRPVFGKPGDIVLTTRSPGFPLLLLVLLTGSGVKVKLQRT